MINLPDITSTTKRDYSSPNVLPLLFKAADKINHDYYNNRELYYKNVKTPLDNVEVDSKDIHILNAAKEDAMKDMSPILEDNSFHKAGDVIFKLQHKISGNGELRMAQQDAIKMSKFTTDVRDGKYGDWTIAQKNSILGMSKLSATSVRTNDDGQVVTGFTPMMIPKHFDTKALNEALSKVDSHSDYGTNSSTVEQFADIHKIMTAQGMDPNKLKDDKGNPMFVGTTTRMNKTFDVRKAAATIRRELSDNKEYQDYLQFEARLALFDAKVAKTTSIKGAAPKSMNDLVKFDGADLIKFYVNSPNEQNYIATLVSQDKKALDAVSVKGKIDPVKLAEFAATYYAGLDSRGIDSDTYYQYRVIGDHMAGTVDNIANKISNRLAYTESSFTMSYQANPNFRDPGSRDDDDSGGLGNDVSQVMMLTPGIETLEAQGRQNVVDRKQSRIDVSHLNEAVANTEASMKASVSQGLTDSEMSLMEGFIRGTVSEADVRSKWTSAHKIDDVISRYSNAYESDGSLKPAAFGERTEAYESYMNTKNRRDQARNVNRQIDANNENLVRQIQPIVDKFMEDYTFGGPSAHKDVNTEKYVNIALEHFPNIMDEYKDTNAGEHVVTWAANLFNGDAQFTRGETFRAASKIRKMISDDYNRETRTFKTPKIAALYEDQKRNIFSFGHVDDIVEDYTAKGYGIQNIRHQEIYNPNKNELQTVVSYITGSAPKTVIWANDAGKELANEFGNLITTAITTKVTGTATGAGITPTTMGSPQVSKGLDVNNPDILITIGNTELNGKFMATAMIKNQLTGGEVLVELPMSDARLELRNKEYINKSLDKAVTTGTYPIGYQDTETWLRASVLNQAVLYNDEQMLIDQFSVSESEHDGAAREFITYLPETVSSGNPVHMKYIQTSGSNGKFTYKAVPVNDNQYAIDHANYLNTRVLNSTYNTTNGIVVQPTGFNSATEMMQMSLYDVMYNASKQKHNNPQGTY